MFSQYNSVVWIYNKISAPFGNHGFFQNFQIMAPYSSNFQNKGNNNHEPVAQVIISEKILTIHDIDKRKTLHMIDLVSWVAKNQKIDLRYCIF